MDISISQKVAGKLANSQTPTCHRWKMDGSSGGFTTPPGSHSWGQPRLLGNMCIRVTSKSFSDIVEFDMLIYSTEYGRYHGIYIYIYHIIYMVYIYIYHIIYIYGIYIYISTYPSIATFSARNWRCFGPVWSMPRPQSVPVKTKLRPRQRADSAELPVDVRSGKCRKM